MATLWVLVARGSAERETEVVTPSRSAVLVCADCSRTVRAFARTLRSPEPREVFACPGCEALLEEAPVPQDAIPPLPGASPEELREAIQQALAEAERWRCQADGARQRGDLAWAEQSVAWVHAATQRVAALQRQAATSSRRGADPSPTGDTTAARAR